MSLTRPSWVHSSVEVLERINRELVQRLNSDQQPAGLWRIDDSQYALSKPGALRIIWSILGGPIERGAQYHGPDMPAKCVAARRCRLQAEIRTIDARTQGFTSSDLMLAEEVLRHVIIVWNKQRPADYDSDEQEEDWGPFTEEPGQRQIICRYRVTPLLLVLGDPYLFKTITSVESAGVLGTP